MAKRGFEPEDVDRAFGLITSRIAASREQRELAEKNIELLSRELSEARIAVKRANSKPTFSDLGAAFEQTLRVAEEQAGKLLQDASEEVSTLRDSAKADADRILVSTERQASKIIAEAEKRAQKIEEESDKRSTELISEAEARLAAANRAEIEAVAVIEDIERNAAKNVHDVLESAQNEREQARREMNTLRELQARDQLRIERDIVVAREKAQREGDRLAAESSAFIAEILADAEVQFAEAQRKEEQLVGEAERLANKAHSDADLLLITSESTAAGILARAQARVNALNQQASDIKATVVAETEMALAALDEERSRIIGFSAELDALETDDK
jgi:hypothetical protein